MTGAELAQLAIILAPVARDIVIEGGKLVATYRDDVTQDQINRALEQSRSATWPDLDFAGGK